MAMNQQRSPHMEESAGEFVTVAKVTKTQGRKGEVAAALFTDFPERFATRKKLRAVDYARGGAPRAKGEEPARRRWPSS